VPFSLLTSDRPATLVERLAADLAREPLSPLDDDVVVVQGQGMGRWVRHELARRHGCAAGIRLPFPAAFAREVATAVDDRPLDPAFERDALAWRILHLLEEGLADEPDFAALHGYAGRREKRKRLGLNLRLALSFDDYLLYRPDVLLDWEAGRPGSVDAPEARWQAALWRRLTAGAEPLHLARWLTGVVARLERGEVDASRLPPRVAIFGASALPPLLVHLFQALGRHLPVRAYLVAPPRATWTTGGAPANPLLAAFGHASRDLVVRLAAGDVEVEEHHDDAEPATVLATLRADLRAGVARGREAGQAAPRPIAAGDRSLALHRCHSPLRELEVLRDELLDALAADPTLRPHDVIVLVPDLATYAPLVEAVFGVGEPELPRIPFRVADRTIAESSVVADAALRLLRLAGARWTAAEIIELLELPPVRRAAGIPAGATASIVRWVEETRIRWGRDGRMRHEEFRLPDLDANSWRAGLDRLLMGYATGRVDDLVAGVAPHAGDTIGDPATLGALARWTARLFDALDGLRAPRSLGEWSVALRALACDFLAAEDEDEARELSQLLRAVDDLDALARDAGVAREVELAVVRDWIERALAVENGGASFLAGGMTVCAMKPMRAIPARLIAMVGLDDATFPRRDRRAAYDLLELERREGDRDLRADDRQLFLDTILSAGDRLHLSYVARSAADNSERASSVVLAELLDIVDASFESGVSDANGRPRPARCRVVVDHRLQPFSPAYYGGDAEGRLFSYSRIHARAARAAAGARATPPFVVEPLAVEAPAGRDVVTLRDLVDCWTNPARWWCERVLGLRLERDEEPLDDCEPMAVDPLLRYELWDGMLRRHLRGTRDAAAERALAVACGTLPSGRLSARWFDRLDEELSELLASIPRWTPLEPLAVEIEGSDWTLRGTIDGRVEGGRLQARPAKCKPKDLVRAWIAHLALSAAIGADVTSTVVALDGTTTIRPTAHPLPLLDALVAGVRATRRTPIPVFEQTSQAYVEQARALARGRASKSAIDCARDKWNGGDWSGAPPGERDDPYVSLCWRGRDPLADAATFERWAEWLWTPLLEHAEPTKAGAEAGR
jgi:exodeoxyribonuclease V gamma subunit